MTSGTSLWIPDDEFDVTKTLYDGGAETGNELIEVPTDDWPAGVLAVSPALLSDDVFVSVK